MEGAIVLLCKEDVADMVIDEVWMKCWRRKIYFPKKKIKMKIEGLLEILCVKVTLKQFPISLTAGSVFHKVMDIHAWSE